jgi:hypothetical protein
VGEGEGLYTEGTWSVPLQIRASPTAYCLGQHLLVEMGFSWQSVGVAESPPACMAAAAGKSIQLLGSESQTSCLRRFGCTKPTTEDVKSEQSGLGDHRSFGLLRACLGCSIHSVQFFQLDIGLSTPNCKISTVIAASKVLSTSRTTKAINQRSWV